MDVQEAAGSSVSGRVHDGASRHTTGGAVARAHEAQVSLLNRNWTVRGGRRRVMYSHVFMDKFFRGRKFARCLTRMTPEPLEVAAMFM